MPDGLTVPSKRHSPMTTYLWWLDETQLRHPTERSESSKVPLGRRFDVKAKGARGISGISLHYALDWLLNSAAAPFQKAMH